MVYIAKQKVYGKDYYYLRQSVRKGSKVLSKCVAYLGKNKKEAEKKAEEIMKKMQEEKIDFNEKKQKEGLRKIHNEKISIDELANFCKRKGFVFRSSDIYGGLAGFWDFGPLGVELFNNIKSNWWNYFVHQRENIVGIDASIISHPLTWKASGHIDNFNVNDYLVICKKCKKSSKIDKPNLGKIKCECGGEYDWETAKIVEQMFKTTAGADKQEAYLRGETAQGMFSDFKLVQQTSRMQLPFGIAQIGKCFRNEIAPKDFLFRSREFHIGEFEFFISPDEKKCDVLKESHLNCEFDFLDEETQKEGSDRLKRVKIKELIEKNKIDEWHAYWLAEQIMWFYLLGLREVKVREHTKDELSHYSSATFDIDYEYPFGSKEIAGNANRGQYDLKQHQKESGQSMEIFDEKSGKKILPRVIEPTFGIERVFLALLAKSYCKNENGEIVLALPAELAPVKCAVFPIIKKEEFENIAEKIVKDLRKEWNVIYDKSGSIGRRYARNDEIGTPFCITVDEESLKSKDVTVRLRDNAKQVRIKINDIREVLRKAIFGEDICKLGKVVNTRKSK